MSILNKTIQKKSGQTKAGYFLVVLFFMASPMLFAEDDQHTHEHGTEVHSEHEKDNHENDEHDVHEAHEEDEHDPDKHGDKKNEDSSQHKDHDHDKHTIEKPKISDSKDDGHDHKDAHSDHDEPVGVLLSKEQIQQAGIQTLQLKKESFSKTVTALGEVKLNQYKTIKVSSIVTTRIEKRHVRLGDKVKKGELLVTLHTISTPDISANQSADRLSRADLNASITTTIAEMEASIAEAKGELAVATANWDRIRSLGRDAVSGKRYTAAKIAREQAAAKLQAYKKSRSKIKKLGKPKSTKPFVKKHYLLRAEQDGIVIQDDFVLGQIVDPEDVLFVISDMNDLWVEANMKPDDVAKIKLGSSASVKTGDTTFSGEVINIGRILDEKTRTLAVRIELHNAGSLLFPGQYVNTTIRGNSTQQAITVPAESVLRGSDGDWILFVEVASGRFEPKEVEIEENLGDMLVVSGIKDGITIVSKGAFTLQSEMAKSGFDVHNH